MISPRIKKGYGFDLRINNHKYKNLEFRKINLNKQVPKFNADYVTLLAVLEHLNNPKKVLSASYKMLNSGGKIILTTPTPSARKILDFLAFLRLIDHKEIEDVTTEHLEKALQIAREMIGRFNKLLPKEIVGEEKE